MIPTPFPRPPLPGPLLRLLLLLLALPGAARGQDAVPPAGSPWMALFNGRDLSGWVPKIRGYPVGEDPLGTFRVEGGLLTVGYEAYGEDFGDRFGHLFHTRPHDRYVLLVEYRFVGRQAPGGPGWARRNSGVMYHAQSPETMGLYQDFPISLEAQFLGGLGEGPRPTHNLCTPGTHVEMDGERVEAHCIPAAAPTYPGDGWVTVELVVDGGDRIRHVVAGDTVLAFSGPVVGGGAVTGFDPGARHDGLLLTGGYLALQSESHPVQFRRVWIREIPPVP